MGKSNTVNVEVTLEEVGGDIERMIKKFSRKVKEEGIIHEVMERRYFKKPSAIKNEIKNRKKRSKIREKFKDDKKD